MNMNFFDWLRNGVKQSVLLGVGDAVDQMGVPPTDDELQPALASLLEPEATTKGKRKTSTAGRKRLGKSLKDMDTAKTA